MSKAKKINVNEMRKAGNAAMEKSDYEEAIKIYSEALLMSNPTDEDKKLLYSNRSHAYLTSAMECGDTGVKIECALQDANDVIKLRPSWWKGYFRAGRVYQFQKEWDRAIDCFNEALALNPDLEDVKNSRDECRFDQMQAAMTISTVHHGFKEEIENLNEMRGLKLDAEVIVKNYEKLMKSKDPKNRATACVFFGIRYVKGVDVPQDIRKGVDLLQEAVDAGSSKAMVELGVLYMEGKVVERNIRKAVTLFEKAAKIDPKNSNCFDNEHDDGVGDAQFHIGLCFESGTGKPVDYYQARQWYEKASERGHAGAANNIAILYDKGYGGPKCSTRAKQFFSLSASRGNSTAMVSMAWKLLHEREVEQAITWFTRALEAGNEHSIENKDNFYESIAYCRKFMKELKQPPSNGSATEAEVENLLEAVKRVTLNKPSIAEVENLADSPIAQYWKSFSEIQKRAEKGHPFAYTLLTAMGFFAEGVKHLKQLNSTKICPKDVASTQEQCIRNLADSFRATEIVAFFEPTELPRLVKICKAKIGSRKSDLDLAARVVYCVLLTLSHNSEMFSFSKMCCQMYPDEVFFYKIHAATYALRQDFEASMKVSDQGLQKFPTNECLLYCKAGAMKMINSYSGDQVIAAFKKFIEHAPFDERTVPEAYYNMAFYSSGDRDEQKFYYKKGQEAELNLLPCLLPYKSNTKSLLDALMVFDRKEKNVGPMKTAQTQESEKLSSAANKLQVTNPSRVQFVLRHRETLKKIFEARGPGKYNFTANLNISFTPQKEQTMSKYCPDGFKEITLRDMNPQKDKVYTKCFINLLVVEDPMFGLLSAIHVVVRDDNGDCINCSFYDLDHFDGLVRQRLSFGSKITVQNPYYRLAVDGSVALRVDDPSSIVYRASGKENSICRYCWKEKPQHSCGNCNRVKYCCRRCQTDDWKVLKHKSICGLKYFDQM